MFARRSSIFVDGHPVVETPLLLPSFSSKGFPEINKIMGMMGEFITRPILVSAYDVHYQNIPKKITFSELIFLDSGGYEARVDHDLSEAYRYSYQPKKWNRRYYESVLKEWKSKIPTIVVNYDTPTQFALLAEQLRAAEDLRNTHHRHLWEFLVKPESKKDDFVPIEKLIKQVSRLRDFAVIGITEKEIDQSLFGAMTKIARLRTAMDQAEVSTPIHIFGSLDPLTSVLYFVAGAEIFDGLTWLRFGYDRGRTVYYQNYAAFRDREGIRRAIDEVHFEMWKNNYYYLERLRTQMINFLKHGDFAQLQEMGEIVADAATQLQAVVKEGR